MRLLLWLLLLGVVLSLNVHAQRLTSSAGNVPNIVHRMEAGELRMREAAFDELMTSIAKIESAHQEVDEPTLLNTFMTRHPQHADRVKLGLIHLLTKENYLFVEDKTPPSDYDEDDSEHYARLINVVASLDDERAIPALWAQ
jgi:hypothetical protein